MSTEPVRITEPTRLAQGEKVDWKRCFHGYSAAEWTLVYMFRGPGTGFNVTATADGSDFAAELAVQAAQTVGRYDWQAWATNIADSTIKRKVAEGTITIEAGYVAGTTDVVELRTPAKIILDAIDAALLVAAGDSVIEYEISTPAGARRVRKSRTEALEQRKYWAGVVARENAAERVRNGKPFGTKIGVRMP